MDKKNNQIKNEAEESAASYYNSLLKGEFEKETDRGAVILAASLFDIQLESLLKSFLVANSSRTDDLFEGATAPLSNFSSKIQMAFRLGLLSSKFARDLNLIRRIRNEFAHNIHGCSFEHSSVKSRVHEMSKSSSISIKSPNARKNFEVGSRGDFLICASWMLWAIAVKVDNLKSLKECEDEFGYQDLDEEAVIKKTNENKEN